MTHVSIPHSYPTISAHTHTHTHTHSHSAAFCFQASEPWRWCDPTRGNISLRDDTHIYCLAIPTFGQGHVWSARNFGSFCARPFAS